MTKEFLYNVIKQHRLAVVSTISEGHKPESALVGFAISENLEIIFDTVKSSRKYQNLIQNPSVAVVIGLDNETTVQYEGRASEIVSGEDEHLKEVYFEVYPDGRERAKTWPGLVHIKIIPKWIRYSNFNEPVVIEEMTAPF
jgi:general stress protein 26